MWYKPRLRSPPLTAPRYCSGRLRSPCPASNGKASGDLHQRARLSVPVTSDVRRYLRVFKTVGELQGITDVPRKFSGCPNARTAS